MAHKKASRRQRRGSAWHWKQTDGWYFTPQGTKRREPLLDEQGKPIRGLANKQAAGLALARVRLRQGMLPKNDSAPSSFTSTAAELWIVARVCSEYLAHCEHAVNAGRMHPEHRKDIVRYLNELCLYCGALLVSELKRDNVSGWVDSHASWRSPVTRRSILGIVLAAFNYVQGEHGIRNPLRGLKKSPPSPRLLSFSTADEQVIYAATDIAFRSFLFAAVHTGLRPFCELAKLTAEHIEETPRGMMWRVYSSKNKRIRKIPVRPEVATLTRQLMITAPLKSGLPIFRNAQGNPWKKVTGVHRFLTIKRRLAWKEDGVRSHYSCYTCRHTFAHRMLSGYWNDGAGCTIETLAELLGDTPKTAFDHYGKEWGQHYQEPLWSAVGMPLKEKRRRPKKVKSI